MTNHYKIIALFGPSGSGKDTLAKILAERKDINEIVSCTTRPMRDYEKDGVDYHFLTNEDFAKKVLDGSMLEATSFRDWFYGTPIDSLKEDKINVGVFNIQGIDCLLKDNRLKIYPIYVACEDKLRLQRALDREVNPDCEEICRRFLTDLQDFEDIPFEYYTHYNGAKVDPNWIIPDLIEQDILSKVD
jgi:guanylate kinase